MSVILDIEAVKDQVSRAVRLNQHGRAAQAARRFESLRRRLVAAGGEGDDDLLLQHARVLLGLSSSRLDVSGDIEASMALLAAAEGLASRAGAKHMQAAIHGQRGLFLLRLGDTEQALASLDAAAELLEAAEPYDQMTILLNRGALHLERGALERAYADLSRCAEIAEAEGDAPLQVMAQHNLGYVDFLAGNIPRAIATMNRAAEAEEGRPHPVGMLDRARVLLEAGLFHDADETLLQASERLRAERMFQDLGETELVRADCALAEGDPVAARRLASSARRRFARRGNLRWQRRAELAVLRAELATADTAGAPARRRLRRLADRAAALRRTCREEGRADLARQAALLEVQSRLTAGDRLDGGTPLRVRRTDPLSSRLVTHEIRARAAHARQDRAATLREIRAGFAELGSYQSSFGSLDLRTAAAVHGVSLSRFDLDLAVRSGRPAEVLASLERSRAVSSRLASVRPAADAETAALLAELRKLEEAIRGLEGDPDTLGPLTRLRSRAATLQREIRRRGWEREGVRERHPGAVAGLSAVRAAVGEDGGAFAGFVAHRGRWLAVVVTPRAARLVSLCDVAEAEELVRRTRADLDALAMPQVPAPMVRVIRSSLAAGLARLDALLLAPLQVGGVPLTISAAGGLVVLPWSLLPSRSGLPVVVTPSASSWLRARERLHVSATTQVSVVAGPGLRRATDEAVRIGQTWRRSSVLRDHAATTKAVREALGGADVVHVAAHGVHEQQSPLFSSLRLHDGPLYAYELEGGARIAPCVVLSSCEAGLSTIRPGDEGLGLTSVLLHLGTKSVLAGVARVRDDVAGDVMERMHRSLSRGCDSASALAAAQAECAGAEAPTPFMCFGATWRI